MEEIRFDPIERKEFFLAKLGGQEVTPPDAVTRIERYLQDIIDGNASTIPPVTRIEYYLAKISGADVEVPDPATRTEYYLAKIAGMDVDPPDPITRLDYFLAQWVETGGGVLETVTGNAPITLADALAKAIVSLTQYGLCAQAATPTPDAHVDIKCNNGALKMLNLANMAESNLDIGYYLNNSGSRQSSASNFYTLGFIPVKPGTAYTVKTSESINYFNIMEYDSARGFLKRTLWGNPAGVQTTFTTRSDTAYLRFGSNMNGNTLTYADIAAVTWMLTEGETAQDYVPYGQLSVVGTPEVLTVTDEDSNAQTASVADLFAVDTYKDTQEIISGAVTRKCGIKILTGEESGWALSDSGTTHRFRGTKPDDCYTPSGRAPILSSHFVYVATGQGQGGAFIGASQYWYFIPTDQTIDTADKWKTWIAEQYAAGTPVIIVYPLSEATTESVAGQSLSTVAGTNVVSVTAEVSPIELEAEYMTVAP